MARRLNPQHDEHTRQKIQTSQLVNLLGRVALDGEAITRERLKAAEILLKKTLPDLSSVEMGGTGGGPVILNITSGVPRVVDRD